ncbi:hypothetical protein [Devosia sediminis]|uniref:DUF4375 domain-containing protein n=1 Tax=Devosia sediminis TaxID=2798801 RepID=A0A934MKB1_9HYPH|nr:hypothetical protein [Devosia sediminis]MBJ3784953.1 hypothetical protein [Devosia sediminis]
MFGFEDKRPAAVEQAGLYIGSMFFGFEEKLGGPLPRQVFTDPYVVGFLEVLTTHAVAVVYMSGMPDQDTVVDIMAEALDRAWPGAGSAARMRLVEASNSVSPFHAEYRRGRHDGSEHVRRLLTTYENMGDERHKAFRDHVAQTHLRLDDRTAK